MDPAFWHDLVAGFQAAPFWAQIGIGFFALTAVAMLFDEPLRIRRFRRQFDAITEGLGRPPAHARKPPMTVAYESDGRRFELTYRLVYRGKGSTYRGPSGRLFVSDTPLAGERWKMHQVDVQEMGGLASWLVGGIARTGDAAFDKRFILKQDGLPPREAWLDVPTRQAFTDFFDHAPPDGLIWIRDGHLQYTMADSWKSMDAAAARALLAAQAALASALDRTAAQRF